MTIPAWNNAGVLPPIVPGTPGNSPERSPYVIELPVLIDRFSTSPERIAILYGLLRFRAALHQAGIVSGFQWLDGSFLEDVERLEERSPRDMDVVNFVYLADLNQEALISQHRALFNPAETKRAYAIDAYFVEIGGVLDKNAVRRVSYWYSMWSHRRDGSWKGFVQVDIDPAPDADARATLDSHRGMRHDQ